VTAPATVTHACGTCGKFAFSEPTVCYWCRKGRRAERSKAAPATRLEQMRETANTKRHRCAGYMCIADVPGERLMCETHIALLPAWVAIKLDQEFNPREVNAWPIATVELAIRYTMTEADRRALVGRVEWSQQESIFGAKASA
jgi:hypothetical protein